MVDLGELNIAEAEDSAKQMARMTNEMFDGFVEVMNHPDIDLSDKVAELKQIEDTCDELLHDITAYLIQCSTHEIGKGNAARIAAMLRVVSEFEEATDRIYRLVKAVQRKYNKGLRFLPEQNDELDRLSKEVSLLLQASAQSLSGGTQELLDRAHSLEDGIDKLRKIYNKASIKRMQDGADVPTEMIFTEINNQLEAVGNHGLNIIQNSIALGER